MSHRSNGCTGDNLYLISAGLVLLRNNLPGFLDQHPESALAKLIGGWLSQSQVGWTVQDFFSAVDTAITHDVKQSGAAA